MKPMILFAGLAASLMVTSCDMMLEGTDPTPGYSISAGVSNFGPWNTGIGTGGWNIGYAPVIGPAPVVGPLGPAPHPPGVPPRPVYGPSMPAPVRPAPPVSAPNRPSAPPVVSTPSIPENGQRPGANASRPVGNPVQSTPAPVQGRH